MQSVPFSVANRGVRAVVGAIVCFGISLGISHAQDEVPDHVLITWMSVTNMYYELGPLRIVTDGYISRIPRDQFYGGGGGYAFTRQAHTPDAEAVNRVLFSLGGPEAVNLLLTGHSHWDHSFDTATWAKLTGAPIVGSKTTCLEAMAQGIPEQSCQSVFGGEKLQTSEGITVHVVRWNHSGDINNPEQHNPTELCHVPKPDAQTGGLRAGVAEDFPNGGGNRAYLFTVDGPRGRFSWFYQNSASPADLHVSIILDGTDYGAPLENLKSAMRDAGLQHVDLWIGTGGVAVAKLLAPVLKPKAYIPVHWDDFFAPFEEGVTRPFSDPELATFLAGANIRLLAPEQYMDKWRLDADGIRPVPNLEIKRMLGFTRARAQLD
jgi:L-ascorbate metabolism protein UlaG (beta-lactamase superfamily)